MKIYEVKVYNVTYEYWFDPQMKVWYYCSRDAEGNLGPSCNSHSKEYALIGIGIEACRDTGDE